MNLHLLLFLLEYFVRLVGGDDLDSGRVEVFYHGAWASVCDDNFDRSAARVVCRMLGKPT